MFVSGPWWHLGVCTRSQVCFIVGGGIYADGWSYTWDCQRICGWFLSCYNQYMHVLCSCVFVRVFMLGQRPGVRVVAEAVRICFATEKGKRRLVYFGRPSIDLYRSLHLQFLLTLVWKTKSSRQKDSFINLNRITYIGFQWSSHWLIWSSVVHQLSLAMFSLAPSTDVTNLMLITD